MLTIGNHLLDNRLILAPLAGYNDLPFRLLCREYGASMCVSEMISSHGLIYQQPRTIEMLKSCADEKPVSYQLFGADPGIIGDAVALLDSYKPDFIDLNMGCPVRKVTKRGAGAALMSDIALAEKIIRQAVANTTSPVTIKIRSGVDSQSICAKEFAVMAEANNVSAVTVHGRTWKQGFSGSADWELISEVKKAVHIPVIGNGDIVSHADALDRIARFGCDGVMIGRAAIGNPWVFRASGRPAHLGEIAATVHRHLQLLAIHHREPQRGLGAIKNHLGRYFRGMANSAAIRREIYRISDWPTLTAFVLALAEGSSGDSQPTLAG